MREYTIRNEKYKIRYNEFEGSGTPIVVIHGLGCAGSFDYVEIFNSEEFKGYRRVLIDLLGAGYSDKPLDFSYEVKEHAKYLEEFLEDLGLNKVILFGHSLGGTIAIELCARCKDRIERLILTEPNLDPSTKGQISWAIAQYKEDNYEKSIKTLIKYCESGMNTMWAATLKNWLPKAVYQISRDAVLQKETSWRSMLYEFDIPKYFIFGENSLPSNDLEELPKHNVNVKTVKNAGHSMAWENPEGLTEVICSCLV